MALAGFFMSVRPQMASLSDVSLFFPPFSLSLSLSQYAPMASPAQLRLQAREPWRISVAEPLELAEWLGVGAAAKGVRMTQHADLVVLDVVSTDKAPVRRSPQPRLVRMDAFDVYQYEEFEVPYGGSDRHSESDGSCCDGDTANDSDRGYFDDDPSDSGKSLCRQNAQTPAKKHSATPIKLYRLPRMVYGNFNLRPAKQLRQALENLGVTFTTRVVVLTQNFKAGVADPISAARAAWLLCYCGVGMCVY